MDVDEIERHRKERLEMLDALCAALDRRREVFVVVEAADDDEDALTGVERLLGVSPVAARAVLDIQLRRLTAQGRTRLHEQREQLLKP
jgi:DNA gyrase subunit A